MVNEMEEGMGKKKFDKVAHIKGLSRATIGAVPPTKSVPLKKRKEKRHKDTIERLMKEEK